MYQNYYSNLQFPSEPFNLFKYTVLVFQTQLPSQQKQAAVCQFKNELIQDCTDFKHDNSIIIVSFNEILYEIE